MATNLKLDPNDPETVRATGPHFDLERVLTVAAKFASTFVEAAEADEPARQTQYRFGYDGKVLPFTPKTCESMKEAFRMRHKRFDVDDYECRIDAGALRLRARLLGWDALYEGEDERIRTMLGLPGDKIDPTPVLAICVRDPGGEMMMDEDQRVLVTRLCEAAATQGVVFNRADDGLANPYVTFISFPYEVFGLATANGPLRIRLIA